MKRIFLIAFATFFCVFNGFAQRSDFSKLNSGEMVSRFGLNEERGKANGPYGHYYQTNSGVGKSYTTGHDRYMFRRYGIMTDAQKRAKAEREAELSAETTTNADGTVTAQWSDGTKYRGQMYYGEIKGVGTMIYADGSKYCGEWAADLPNGNGTFMTPEGVIYSVKWVNGLPHGKGVIQDLDGRKYTARWVGGELKKKSIKPLKEKK